MSNRDNIPLYVPTKNYSDNYRSEIVEGIPKI